MKKTAPERRRPGPLERVTPDVQLVGLETTAFKNHHERTSTLQRPFVAARDLSEVLTDVTDATVNALVAIIGPSYHKKGKFNQRRLQKLNRQKGGTPENYQAVSPSFLWDSTYSPLLYHVRVLVQLQLHKHLQQPKHYFDGVLRRFVQSLLQFLRYATKNPTNRKAVSRDQEFRYAKSRNAEFAGVDEPESQRIYRKMGSNS